MKIKQTILAMVLLSIISCLSVFSLPAFATTCAGVETSVISCDGKETTSDLKETGLWQLLLLVINILTAGVGIMAVAGVVYGSILYSSSGGSPEQTKKAIGIIINTFIGIVAYALMYAFLNFIIPGGLFT
ncbi:MAG: hypothetical protein PWQ10_435 [Patescibacteria group bacterium]|nr:hypothetical protein [Patescibacteria group bacterium]